MSKPGDARIYLNIIERLARMNWLDDTPAFETKEPEWQPKMQPTRTTQLRPVAQTDVIRPQNNPTPNPTETKGAHIVANVAPLSQGSQPRP